MINRLLSPRELAEQAAVKAEQAGDWVEAARQYRIASSESVIPTRRIQYDIMADRCQHKARRLQTA